MPPEPESKTSLAGTQVAVVETAPFGGLLHYSVQLANALAERGLEVDLLTPRGNELVNLPGAAHMRAVLAPPLRSAEEPPVGRLGRLARKAGIAFRLSRAWARILFETRRRRYDVVLVAADIGLPPATVGAYLLTALPGAPPVAHIRHNVRSFNRWGGQEMFESGGVMRGLRKRFTNHLGMVFVHGERALDEFQKRSPGVPAAVIPHGDERVFGDPPPATDEERILFFGDWRKVKGMPLLMDAFDVLAERRPSVRLTIAGRPALQDIDPELIRRWAAGHGERVKVIDHYVPIEDVPSVFAEARVVATPYFVGYQSGVIHLAMTMGRAVVATDVGDLGSAVVDQETGLVIPPEDAGLLADALERVVSDAELANRMGEQARQRVLERSGWEKVAQRVEEALAGVYDGRAAGRAG
jgi:glycosyltransferase involved in cell wall biosynthesis